VIGRAWRVGEVGEGLDLLRLSLQRGLRPMMLRLYDPEDAVLQGLEGGGCLLLGASAGPAPVAEAEAAVMGELMQGEEALGAGPWERWLRHRFDLSADRLQDLLEPPGAYVDTIEVAASWTDLPALYRGVKAHLAQVADLALCHFSHCYRQGCCAYFTFLGSAGDESKAEAAYLEAWRGAMEITLACHGTISHHHGVGQVRAAWVQSDMGGWATVWERVRQALDPERSMNPHAVGGLDADAG
jgi:alkyldihydroxyacetonephosphate synthase